MIDGVSNMFMAAVGNAKALVGIAEVTSPSGVISEAGDALAEGSASITADVKGEGAKLAAIMSQESGPIVKCVCLRAGGAIEELTLDMAPKQQAIFGALGGPPTFLGQYENIGVFVTVRKYDASLAGAPASAHVLPVPFADEAVRGDVLLFRVTNDDDAEPVDFTVAEYEAFKAQPPDAWQQQIQARLEAAEAEEKEEDDEEDEEDEEDDDEDDEDDEDADEQYNSDDAAEDEAENDDEDALKDLMLAKLLDEFETRSGRAPTDEEHANIEAALDARLGGGDDDSGLTAEEEQQAENIVLAKVCEAFAAQHGREPTADEIKDILSRLRDADAAGAADEEGEEEEDDDEEEEEEEEEEEQAAADAGGAAASAGAADDAGDDDEGEDGGVDGIIEELTAMYEKEHGAPPTEEVVKSWIATIKEANLDAGAVAGAAAAADDDDDNARPAKRARSDSIA